MIMGQYAASNILKLIKRQEEHRASPMPPQDLSSTEDLLQCPEFEPMMALSVGDEGVAYTKASGVIWGKHIKDNYIGRGLGIDSKFCRERFLSFKPESHADSVQRMFGIPEIPY
jgi:hypothetical protein